MKRRVVRMRVVRRRVPRRRVERRSLILFDLVKDMPTVSFFPDSWVETFNAQAKIC